MESSVVSFPNELKHLSCTVVQTVLRTFNAFLGEFSNWLHCICWALGRFGLFTRCYLGLVLMLRYQDLHQTLHAILIFTDTKIHTGNSKFCLISQKPLTSFCLAVSTRGFSFPHKPESQPCVRLEMNPNAPRFQNKQNVRIQGKNTRNTPCTTINGT